MKRKTRKLLIITMIGFIPLVSCGSSNSISDDPSGTTGGTVTGKATVYMTSATGMYSLTKINADILSGDNNKSADIEINPSLTYQTMDGFGAAITYSTAYNLLKMSQTDRTNFLRKTFSDTDGYGFSYVRISIGCSDFSSKEYTCCDNPGIENFGLQSDDINYVIPVMKEILAINPHLKVIGSPWTCPQWMKVEDINNKTPHNSWTDGHLNPDYYQTYSDYFVKWINAYQSAGVPIYAITPQNEPLNKGNCASLYMPWSEEADFLKVLTPTFKKNGLTTKIYAYDHNYDAYSYPLNVYKTMDGYEGSEYVVGAAFHNYLGDESSLDAMHNSRPDKGLIFSEASIGTWNDGRNLRTRLLDDMQHIALGTVNKYCTAVIVWNLMLDSNMGPNLDGGCQTCYGAVDINKNDYKTISLNSHYYVIAHLSSVIKPGAVRIGTTEKSLAINGIIYSAFKNTDGSYGMVLCNTSDMQQNISLILSIL
ncbi:MAG TPA: glycoside hydrolase family 30 beta sandwich domain-containing protein [Xylanibacter oryzae]|nr:glycoside hydrolase family 30 beta sandwich domain-containing protein [Xylanibacter oryzae]